METRIESQQVFIALTRPQMFCGVTYSFFVINGILSTELYLITKSAIVIGLAGIIHVVGAILALREPRIFDIWFLRLTKVPRTPNFDYWLCNSYQP
jgi:type IV secretion system protein VirB3